MASKSGGSDYSDKNLPSYDDVELHLPPTITNSASKTGGFEGIDASVDDYGNGKVQEDERKKNLRQRRVSKQVKPEIQQKILEKRKSVSQHKEKATIDETVEKAGLVAFIQTIFYCVFCAILTTIVLSTTTIDMHDLKGEMTNTFIFNSPNDVPAFQDVLQHQDIWGYVENQFMDQIFWSEREGNDLNDTVIDANTKLIGAARLRMLKVRNGTCKVYYPDDENKECYYYYTKENEDRAPFGPADSTAFIYTDHTESPTYGGIFGPYGSGGFIQEILPGDLEATTETIQILKANQWISRETRAIFLDFTVYNCYFNLLTHFKLYFELPPTGGVIPDQDVTVFKLFNFLEPNDYFIHGCEAVFCIFTLCYFIQECKDVYKYRIKYFSDLWNFYDLTVTALSITLIVAKLKFEILAHIKMNALTESKAYIEMNEFVYLWSLQSHVGGILTWIAWGKLLKYSQQSERAYLMLRVVGRVGYELIAVGIYFSTFFFGMAFFGYLQWGGGELQSFASLGEAWFTMVRYLVGDFEYDSIRKLSPLWAPVFICFYFVMVIVFLLNIFLAVINISYTAAKETTPNPMKKYVLGAYVQDKCNKLLQFLFDETPTKVEPNIESVRWINELKQYYDEEKVEKCLKIIGVDETVYINKQIRKNIERRFEGMLQQTIPLPNLETVEDKVAALNELLKDAREKAIHFELSEVLKNAPPDVHEKDDPDNQLPPPPPQGKFREIMDGVFGFATGFLRILG